MTDGWKEIPRLAITGIILALFTYGAVSHWGVGIEETLKNLAVMATGFWLGSSKGSSDSATRADKAIDLAVATQAANGVDSTVTLKPGETAQAEKE